MALRVQPVKRGATSIATGVGVVVVVVVGSWSRSTLDEWSNGNRGTSTQNQPAGRRLPRGRRMIAFKEMVRAKVRFGLLVGAIGLLVFLILFQQALRDGLITSFVGAIEQQSAPVLVFSTDGRRNLQSSSITPELEARVRAVDGVAPGRAHRPEHVERAGRRSDQGRGDHRLSAARSRCAAQPGGRSLSDRGRRGCRQRDGRRRRASGWATSCGWSPAATRSGSSASLTTRISRPARPCSPGTGPGNRP